MTTPANPFDGGAGWGIANNGNTWVAVGNNTDSSVCIARSIGANNWTDSSNNPFLGGYGYGIAYGGTRWVATGINFGESVSIAYSDDDGVSWNPLFTPFDVSGVGYGVAHDGGSTWVAVGNNADKSKCLLNSTDGVFWMTVANNPFDGGTGYGVAYANSRWIAVGYNSGNTVSIATSTNASVWTDASNNPFGGGSGRGVAFDGSGTWVAVGDNSDNTVCIAYSNDGVSWTDASDNPFVGGRGNGVAYYSGLWVAVGQNADGSVTVAESIDGDTWTLSTNNPFTGGFGSGIAHANKWVAVGSNGVTQVTVVTSTYGDAWTPATGNSNPLDTNNTLMTVDSSENPWVYTTDNSWLVGLDPSGNILYQKEILNRPIFTQFAIDASQNKIYSSSFGSNDVYVGTIAPTITWSVYIVSPESSAKLTRLVLSKNDTVLYQIYDNGNIYACDASGNSASFNLSGILSAFASQDPAYSSAIVVCTQNLDLSYKLLTINYVSGAPTIVGSGNITSPNLPLNYFTS